MSRTLLGMTLQEFMTIQNLKDADLTGLLGVGRSMVTKLRLRATKPSFDVATKIAAMSGGCVSFEEMAPARCSRPASETSEFLSDIYPTPKTGEAA